MRLLLVAILVTSLAACGSAGSSENTAPNVEAALLERFEAQLLSVKRITCVDSGHQYDGRRVFRCNVNFGDPHIPGYCALLVDGQPITHIEEPALRCARERTPDGEPVG